MLNYISIRSELEAEAKITHQPPIYVEITAKYQPAICLKTVTTIAKPISFSESGENFS